LGKRMGGSFGQGAYGVYVTWKALDGDGNHMESLYRYKTEEERDRKVREFKGKSKVKSARPISGYSSW
jgi:hypothetical protein